MFSTAVVCYLFLGGAGAGGCFLLSVCGLLVPRERLDRLLVNAADGHACSGIVVAREYRTLFAPGFTCSIACILLGVVFLAVDLGHADRLLLLATQPQLTHLTVGAYSLIACALLAFAATLVWCGCARSMSWGLFVVLEAVLAVCSIVVMAYTGLLLQALQAVPLFNSVWLPALFIASSLSCGAALVLATAQFSGARLMFADTMRNVTSFDIVVIVIEMTVAAMLLASVHFDATASAATASEAVATTNASSTGTSLAAAQSLEWLLLGEGSVAFWGGFVAFGLAAPLAIDCIMLVRRSKSANLTLIMATSVLVGAFAMRWSMVSAGMHPVLTSVGLG